ncbi:MAG: hypothetical protein GF331_03585, partial [Chitinivibrionales bacterium]|nr:hypothetical protein [Chitinivibrionales bacterium]
MEKGGWVMRIRQTIKRGALTGGILAAFVTSAVAGPVVSGSEVRAFLGGVTGKLVYTHLDSDDIDKCGKSIRYLDFSEETLTEHEVMNTRSEPDETEPRNALISPDGEWIAYNTLSRSNCWSEIWQSPHLLVCRLQANASNHVYLGNGALPHWWRKPGTDEMYIIYNTKDLEDGGWTGA